MLVVDTLNACSSLNVHLYDSPEHFVKLTGKNSTPCLKKVSPLACYNFDTCERILIFLAEMLPIK